MPLIVKNLVLRGNQAQEPAPQPQPQVVEQPKPKVRERTAPVAKSALKPDEPAVIVNGKAKKISKKSAFLLDMLSLDD